MAQEENLNSPEKTFQFWGMHIHEIVRWIAIAYVAVSVASLALDLYIHGKLILLGSGLELVLAGLLMYGQAKSSPAFYIPYIVATGLGFLIGTYITLKCFGQLYYCLLFKSSGCKSVDMTTEPWECVFIFGLTFVEGLVGYLVYTGYRYLVQRHSQPLPSLSYPNPTAEV